VTISVGVAEFNEQRPTVDAVLKAADKALYQAKETGRNRTVVAS
jgi:diguanylate cyclase